MLKGKERQTSRLLNLLPATFSKTWNWTPWQCAFTSFHGLIVTIWTAYSMRDIHYSYCMYTSTWNNSEYTVLTASILYLQWSPFNADTIWTATACPEYRGVCISNAPCIFLVGVAMHTHALKRYKGTFQSSSLLYAGEKANHRLVCTMCTNLICYNNIQL